jgi:hypothetical protein
MALTEQKRQEILSQISADFMAHVFSILERGAVLRLKQVKMLERKALGRRIRRTPRVLRGKLEFS